jgi:hypothetical protein
MEDFQTCVFDAGKYLSLLLGPCLEVPKSRMPSAMRKDVYQSFLAYGNQTAGLPSITQWPSRTDGFVGASFWNAQPNYSYGIAGDSHPTSFEIYNVILSPLVPLVKSSQ